MDPLGSDPENAVRDLLPGWHCPHANRVTVKKETLHISTESHQQIVTYIFIELWETGAEVEDRCQVSTYIASDFH